MNLHDEIEWVFPFENMSRGESFFIPTTKPSPILHAIESGAKRANIRVKVFITVKDKCLGVRAWRLT